MSTWKPPPRSQPKKARSIGKQQKGPRAGRSYKQKNQFLCGYFIICLTIVLFLYYGLLHERTHRFNLR